MIETALKVKFPLTDIPQAYELLAIISNNLLTFNQPSEEIKK